MSTDHTGGSPGGEPATSVPPPQRIPSGSVTHASGPRAGQPLTEPTGIPAQLAEVGRGLCQATVHDREGEPEPCGRERPCRVHIPGAPGGCTRRWGDWDDLRISDACPDCGWGRLAHPTAAEVVERPAAGPTPDTAASSSPADEGGTRPGVLGRALLDIDGDLWRELPDGRYRCGGPAQQRDEFEEFYGPVVEVLLVSPSAGRVLDAARRFVRAWDADPFGPVTAAAKAALAAAVDAHAAGQPAEPAPEPEDSHSLTDHARLPTGPAPDLGISAAEVAAAMPALAAAVRSSAMAVAPTPVAVRPEWAGTCLCEDREAHDPDCRQGHGPECGADCWGMFGCPRRHDPGHGNLEPATDPRLSEAQAAARAAGGRLVVEVEPAPGPVRSDPPLWGRDRREVWAATQPAPEPDRGTGWDRQRIEALHGHVVTTEVRDQLRALLADRDRLAAQVDPEAYNEMAADLARAEQERDEARGQVEQAWTEVAGVRAELARMAGDLADRDATLALRTRQLADAEHDREALFRTHEFAAAEHERELATARRAAFAMETVKGDLAEARTEADHMRDRIDRLAASQDAAQDDLAAILRELGLGDHARPISPQQVVHDEVLPAVGRLRAELATARREIDDYVQWSNSLTSHIPDEYDGDYAQEEIISHWVADMVATAERLRAELATAIEERDLAIAHDRQPYPTADAYERACAALEKHRGRADRAETELADARRIATNLETDRDRLRAETQQLDSVLAKEVAAAQRLHDSCERLTAERVELVDELDRLRADREHDADVMREVVDALPGLDLSRPVGQQIAAALATARLDAAADTRDCLAELVALKDGPRAADYERRKPAAWERARAIVRPVPGSPEPTQGGGEDG